MAKKTKKIIDCENINCLHTDGSTVFVKPTCPRKVAVGNKFITTMARCIKCEKEKKRTIAEIKPQAVENGELVDEV